MSIPGYNTMEARTLRLLVLAVDAAPATAQDATHRLRRSMTEQEAQDLAALIDELPPAPSSHQRLRRHETPTRPPTGRKPSPASRQGERTQAPTTRRTTAHETTEKHGCNHDPQQQKARPQKTG